MAQETSDDRRKRVQRQRSEHAVASKSREQQKAKSLRDIHARNWGSDINLLHNANAFAGGAGQLPFSATGLLHIDGGVCVGAVIHNVHQVGAHAFDATYVLTAGHCCYEKGVKETDFRFAWGVNGRVARPRWNLREASPHVIVGPGVTHVDGSDDRHDWCVVCFTQGAGVGHAPAKLAIKYEGRQQDLPPGEKLLLSTYWTMHQEPPNPHQDDYMKKYVEVNIRREGPGTWKLKKEYTAVGMSGSPFVETGNPGVIRATLASGDHTDTLCRIDQAEFNAIRAGINAHLHTHNAVPLMAIAPDPLNRPNTATSAAHIMSYNGYHEIEADQQSDASIIGHHGHDHNEHGEMELVTNKYYNQYGEHDHDHPDNVYLFAMGVIMTIGICCFVMIISIMINFCACVASKYYKMRDYRQSKHGGDRYNIIEHDVDGDQV